MSLENQISNTEGISVITATNRENCMNLIFANYVRQQWDHKELIIILNNDVMNLKKWKMEAKKYEQVTVYQLPENMTLGKCLNYGVEKSNYKYIAKFDDDDYYGPKYLDESIETMNKMEADVVGKRTCFMYLTNKKELRIRFTGKENCEVDILQGATIFTTKKLLQLLPFPNKNLGECLHFLQRCKKKGYKICASSRYNYTILRKEAKYHTWRPTKEYLDITSERIAFTEDYIQYVDET
ncbi:glycosyltransferase family 2 protein [Metabacillus halosaccharovorans]|uniref:Glycosyltransferase n=1 Tax=Metabacillus halosaccharovorans TaxID=930124 RepID=A0ABT3DL82_9BACI|nr:glycosyltransferase [Metabacillus halosaccharovorans]MCV9887819.1 glycosyltransferase [Metabacillus halosaccharovorans]